MHSTLLLLVLSSMELGFPTTRSTSASRRPPGAARNPDFHPRSTLLLQHVFNVGFAQHQVH